MPKKTENTLMKNGVWNFHVLAIQINLKLGSQFVATNRCSWALYTPTTAARNGAGIR